MRPQQTSKSCQDISLQDSSRQSRKERISKIRKSMRKFDVLNQNHKIRDRVQQAKKNTSEESKERGRTIECPETDKDIRFEDRFSQKYELLEKLGQGSNGVVYRCIQKRGGQVFAVKRFTVQEEQVPEMIKNFNTLSSLDHPGIIHHRSLYLDLKKHSGWLVMDLAEGAPLNKTDLLEEKDIKNVIFQLLNILAYLQNQCIVHRDIKPDNIIYNPQSKAIKLIDFGISKKCLRGDSLWTNTGTLFYRAPEMFEGTYQDAIDIWATGVLLYWAACGQTPFQSQYTKEVVQNIRNARFDFPSNFKRYSEEMKDLVSKMLTKNDQERPKAAECLKDSWFSPLATQSPIISDYSDLLSLSISLKSTKKRQYSPQNLIFLPEYQQNIIQIHSPCSEQQEGI